MSLGLDNKSVLDFQTPYMFSMAAFALKTS